MGRPAPPPFLRLDRTSWRRGPGTRDLVEDRSTGELALGRDGQFPIPPQEPFGSFGGRTRVRGIALWPDGQLVVADPGGNRVLYFRNPFGDGGRPPGAPPFWPLRELWTPTSPPASPFPEAELPEDDGASPDPYTLSGPTDVARSPRGDLVVVDSGHARLLVFSWPDLRVREVIGLRDAALRSVAFDDRGRAYVADAGRGRILRFDALWREDRRYGVPGDDGDGSPGLVRPEHVAVSADGIVWVVDGGTQQVVRLDESGLPLHGEEGTPVGAAPAGLFDADFPAPLEFRDGSLFHPRFGRPRCEPLELRGIRVDRRGRLHGTSLPLLARSQRLVIPRNGAFLSNALDGESTAFPWDRVVLDAVIPQEGRLVVSTLTADEELSPERLEERAGDWSIPLAVGPDQLPEVLVQSPPGRFLWLRVEFLGDGDTSPRVHRIDVHGPRRSSLRFLPPPFHEVDESARFLDRLLTYFDTVYGEIEATVAAFPGHLDPYAASGEFLEWLGRWFDWRFLATWPESTRQEMVAHSIRFFRERGTVPGLRRMIQWHSGLREPFPIVVEHFRLRDYPHRRIVPEPDLPGGRLMVGGRPLDPPPGERAHRFTVIVPSTATATAEAREQLLRVLTAQKPAHTEAELRVVRPGLRIGCQSSVGVDTWLGDYPTEALGRMTLGSSARLESSPHLESQRMQGLRLGSSFFSD